MTRCMLRAYMLAAWLSASVAMADPRAGTPDDWGLPLEDSKIFWMFLGDQFEHRLNKGGDEWRWDVEGWVGGDWNRLVLKTEGELEGRSPRNGEAEVQLVYGRLISPFWDFQIGLREDVRFAGRRDARARTFATIGFEGLAPYWFELTPALFVSDEGDVSARVTASHELLFTQRLILQSRFELNAAFQNERDFEIRSGVNEIELGLRLRYEFRRQLAPYLGLNWERKLGKTARFARQANEDVDRLGFVAGARIWF